LRTLDDCAIVGNVALPDVCSSKTGAEASMIGIIAFAAALAAPVLNGFISPIDRIPSIDSMRDISGDIVYADRQHPFFVIIKGDTFYIGHPIGEGGMPGDDVAYTWGKVEECSNKTVKCTQLGAQVFIRPVLRNSITAYLVKKTAVTIWEVGNNEWWGSGVRSAYAPYSEAKAYDYRPIMTYSYKLDSSGKVSRIILTYWRLQSAGRLTYELKLETGIGLQL
jgi:hypothetical protein